MRHLIVAAALSLSCSAIAETWTVDDDGPANFDNIQAAIDAASDGDEIVVEPGTYTSTGNQVVDMLGKAITLRGSELLSEESIIDGEGLRRGILCDSGETPATEIIGFVITGGFAQKGGGLYFESNSNPSIVACIISGNAASDSYPTGGGGIYCSNSSPIFASCWISYNTVSSNYHTSGGGIACFENSSPTLTNCVISNNTADNGAGVQCSTSSPMLDGCNISNNIASSPNGLNGAGGGISCWDNSNPTLTNCEISNNTALYTGGGISSYDSNPTLINTNVCGNDAPDQIYGGWTDGGDVCIAFSCEDWDGDGVPDKCQGSIGDGIHEVPSEYATVQEAINAAGYGDTVLVAPGTYTGTGDWVINPLGKPITIRATGTPEETILDGEGARSVVQITGGEDLGTVIEGFTITGGVASSGGGIYCSSSSPTITNCTITNNIAGYSGGGIYCNGSSPTITGCTISGNTATYYGGGGIYCHSSSPTISGCTISNNSDDGIYCDASASSPTIIGCTISNNTRCGINQKGDDNNPTLTDTLLCGNIPYSILGPWTDDGWNLFWDDCNDCNTNGIDDAQDILDGTVTDVDNDGIPDECETDCDGDGTPDPLEIYFGEATDWDGDGHPDNCQEDCDGDGYPDDWAIKIGFVQDCDDSGVPDTCEADCNENGLHDSCDIDNGTSEDADADGIPDECQCLGDTNGSGDVDINDLLLVISQWGLVGGSADVNNDGIVDTNDLLLVLSAWGACP